MKTKCLNCYEWSYETFTCPYCESAKPEIKPKTEQETTDEVLDRLRGGPKHNLRKLASECEMSYEDLMNELDNYVNGYGDRIHLGVDSPSVDNEMWDWYELVTGRVVPAHKRNFPFSCSC